MKKLIYTILLVLGTGLFFSSCTREYICQCTLTYSGKPGLPEPLVKEYPITDTKKNAISLCEEKSRTYDDNGVHTEEVCEVW